MADLSFALDGGQAALILGIVFLLGRYSMRWF